MKGAAASTKPHKGLAMEGLIATWYARNTARDQRRFRRTAQIVTQCVAPGGEILEVAPGPGYLAIEIAKSGSYTVTGLDVSHSFVRIARQNARTAGVSVDFRHGSASDMPLPDDSFDFVVCTAAFKNFTDPLGALDEFYRVLKPGGRALIDDLRKDATLEEIRGEVREMGLSAVNAAITRWIFERLLLKNAYSRDALIRLVTRSRFGSGEVVTQGIGFELWLQKQTPIRWS